MAKLTDFKNYFKLSFSGSFLLLLIFFRLSELFSAIGMFLTSYLFIGWKVLLSVFMPFLKF